MTVTEYDQATTSETVYELSHGRAFKAYDGCVWVVVADNLLEVGTCFRHGACSRLTEPDAVSLAGAFENDMIALDFFGETIAWNSAPA